MEFKCWFEKCIYKNESLINVFKHMETKHKLQVGRNLLKLKEVKN